MLSLSKNVPGYNRLAKARGLKQRRLPFLIVRFDSGFPLRVSLCCPRSFLRRGALLPYTANDAHYLLRGYLLVLGDAGMAGAI